MPRPPNNRTGGRDPGGRSLRGATPAQRSRYLDSGGLLQAPNLERWGTPVPTLGPMPSITEMTSMSVEQLGEVLDKFGIIEPWAQQRAAMVGYPSRVANYPPGSPQFKSELDKLLDTSTKRGALMAARRAYTEYSARSFEAGVVVVRVCEDDPASCDTCVKLGGYEGTMEQQRGVGMVGAASCQGGDNCRCYYIEVSNGRD